MYIYVDPNFEVVFIHKYMLFSSIYICIGRAYCVNVDAIPGTPYEDTPYNMGP